MRWISGIIDRIFAVMGALFFLQIPLFMQQYQQHLSGHVEELKNQVQAMSSAASITGKSLHQYVVKFLSSGDLDFKHQGDIMHNMIERYQSLMESYTALQEATIYNKPFVFLKHLDWTITKSTWKSFEIGFSFSIEGMVYAFLGMVFGLTFYWLLRKSLKGLFKPIAT